MFMFLVRPVAAGWTVGAWRRNWAELAFWLQHLFSLVSKSAKSSAAQTAATQSQDKMHRLTVFPG